MKIHDKRETRIEVDGYTLTLRPATSRSRYPLGREERYAYPSKSADGAWLIVSRSGEIVGLLTRDDSPGDPWAVQNVAPGPAGSGEVSVSASLFTGATAADAIAYWQRVPHPRTGARSRRA